MKEMLGILIIAVAILMFLNGGLPLKAKEIFDPQFYIAQPVTIRVSTSESFKFPSAGDIYTEAPAKYEYISSDVPLNDLENGQLDIILEQRLKRSQTQNVRFVANVQESTLILMSPNQYPIQDLSDLSKLLRPPVIKVDNQATEIVVRDILPDLPLNISVNPTESPVMYAFLTTHPSKAIAELVSNTPMHVVTMSKINNGNYFVSEDEKPFYSKHKYYQKASFDMHTEGVKYYPGLSIRGQLLYYPTIKCKYTIYARSDFPAAAVERLLINLLNRNVMPLAEVAYNPDESIPTHEGARSVYQREKIYTKKPRPPIWQGF